MQQLKKWQQSKNVQENQKKKVGLLGGTFDPIHSTHLYVANVVRETCSLDEIWFVPAKLPPHKQDEQVSSADERIEMVRLAIQDIAGFKLSLVEHEVEGPSYTFQTVSTLQESYPDHVFSFVIGADMVEYLPKWYRIEELVEMIPFIGVGRPGWSLAPEHPYRSYVSKVETVPSHISSTLIRELKGKGQSIRFLVPEAVYRYIEEKQLYGKEI
ncbi:nicotinate-nucleotide adenylyltransferase [Bacillus horti]|uniref:Probable nicotinate-nucleotide adenylyltransferase n=1 Tax=Caldalkalibacillus horti TaxID=77523 RepID=A0ABT9VT08_9BACI|nr:nicotinate-nucleotide adenylyltransferase [Bacillus horti]MDQ0164131.1 nicotinate-nucleotide adenylyltransferase [Bacillus horti]